MVCIKNQFSILFYFIFLINKYIDASNSKTCTQADDCRNNTKCISYDKENYCVLPCKKDNEKDQCGEKNKCLEKDDIEGRQQWICNTKKGCLTDNECAKISPKSTCNLYNLQCTSTEEDKKTTTNDTTTTTIYTTKRTTPKKINTTKKPECVDKVPPGPNGCSKLSDYCNDTNYKEMLVELCPKTCGNCNGTGIGITKSKSECKDNISTCSNKLYLCKIDSYRDLMKTVCKKSCNHC
uniref:ShKT domain-containing protein n=1 Tax=Strongyloides papillosus TaxID=174720 RepID=A0A0N5BJC6_STREA